MESTQTAEKGKRYATIFRKAGVLLGKGKIARAVQVLKDGQTLARQLGDGAMARRYATEISRVQKGVEGSGME
jgi:hypothetical protein